MEQHHHDIKYNNKRSNYMIPSAVLKINKGWGKGGHFFINGLVSIIANQIQDNNYRVENSFVVKCKHNMFPCTN